MANLELPEIFFESLHESIGSTRLELDEDGLVSVIHDVHSTAHSYKRSIAPLAIT